MQHKTNHAVRKAQYLEQLFHVLEQLHPLSEPVKNFFKANCELRICRRGEMVVKQQEICLHYYFICKGVLRGFIDQAGKQLTTWISMEGEMATSIHSLHQKAPALENIEALEDGFLLQLSIDEMEQLYTQLPEFNITGRILLQRYYRDAELRAYLARIPDAEEKYRFFCTQYPHLANRVPLKFIASYLGIRQETLSRIRNKAAS